MRPDTQGGLQAQGHVCGDSSFLVENTTQHGAGQLDGRSKILLFDPAGFQFLSQHFAGMNRTVRFQFFIHGLLVMVGNFGYRADRNDRFFRFVHADHKFEPILTVDPNGRYPILVSRQHLVVQRVDRKQFLYPRSRIKLFYPERVPTDNIGLETMFFIGALSCQVEFFQVLFVKSDDHSSMI